MKATNGSRRLAYVITAVVAAGALAIAGCTSDDEIGPDETTVDTAPDGGANGSTSQSSAPADDDSTGSTVEGSSGADTDDGAVDTAHRAIEIALADSPGSAVVEIERDTSDGVDVWELNLLTADGAGHEIKIAVDDGRIVKQGSTTLDAEQQSAPKVTAAEVIAIALDAQPGELLGAELDTEKGVVVWQVKVRSTSGAEVKTYFDPATGDVVQPGR